MFWGKYDSSFDWPFNCPFNNNPLFSFFPVLSASDMIENIMVAITLGWAVSAWTMNPWWTLLAFKIDLAQSGHSFNEGYSLDLHLKFGDLNETMFFVFFFNGKLCAAEADISWLLIATMGQALKTLQFPYCHSLAYFIRSSQPGTSYNSTPLCFNGDSRLQIFKFPSPNRGMGYFFILWKPSSRARKYII